MSGGVTELPTTMLHEGVTLAELLQVLIADNGRALEGLMTVKTNIGDFTVHLHMCASRGTVNQPHKVH